MLFCSLIKEITLNICMLCFALMKSTLSNLVCVWILFAYSWKRNTNALLGRAWIGTATFLEETFCAYLGWVNLCRQVDSSPGENSLLNSSCCTAWQCPSSSQRYARNTLKARILSLFFPAWKMTTQKWVLPIQKQMREFRVIPFH